MSSPRLTLANILCPTDFSISSANALERASTLAGWFHAKLTLLHAIPYAPPSMLPASPRAGGAGPDPMISQRRTEVERELGRLTEMHARAGQAVAWEIADGDPWRAIEARASSLPADLVVMGNKGRSAWERFLVGSTTEKVMRRLRCPILAVGTRETERKGLLFRRILCALDLTPSSRDTIDLALALAEENLAEVTLLHVLDGARARGEEAAKDELRRLAERCWTFCRTEAAVATGTPWREVARVAEEIQADLIVVGAQGEAGLGTSFLGSTADQVLRHAARTVLVARRRALAVPTPAAPAHS